MQRTVHMLAMVGMSALALSLGQLAGCASAGQDENYKMLEEDRPMFETKPDLDKPGASLQNTRGPSLVLTAPERENEAAGQGEVDMTPPPNPPANDGPQPVSQPATEPAPSAEAQSNLQQSQTPQNDPATYDAATAKATREALRYSGMEPSVTGLDRSQWKHMTVGPNLDSAYRSSYFTDVDPARTSKKDMAMEPLVFGWDVVALPVRMVMTPPWQRHGYNDDAAVSEVHIKADEWKHDPRKHDPRKHDPAAKAVCETCSAHAGKSVTQGSACCTSDDRSCCVKDAACCK